MKKLIFFLLIMALCTVAISQKKPCDCKSFATGTFYMPPSPLLKDTLFIYRTADKQTEIAGKYEKAHRVTWLSACKFIVHDSKNRGTKFEQYDVMMKIIETGEDYYVVMAWTKGGKKRTLYCLHLQLLDFEN